MLCQTFRKQKRRCKVQPGAHTSSPKFSSTWHRLRLTGVFRKALRALEPLEDYDLSDDCDWFTLARALGRVDARTAALMRTAACALRATEDARLVMPERGDAGA